MRVTYIGHATVLLELDGVRLLTDPVLSQRVWHLRRHADRPDLDRVTEVDAVLLSHLHGDHLHRRSLATIAPDVPVVAPTGAGSVLRRYGRNEVCELAVGESVSIGSIEVSATPAAHEGGLPLLATGTEALGFIVSGTRSAYFAGDTDLFDSMAEIGGPGSSRLDLALLPVWGWGPMLGSGHLDPRSAAKAAALLEPRIAVPIHWGTLFPLGLGSIADRYLSRPPHRFAAETKRIAPDVSVEILSPGTGSLQLAVAAGS